MGQSLSKTSKKRDLNNVASQVAESRKLVHLHEGELHLVRDLSGTRASAITDGVLYTVTQTGRVSTEL